MPTVINARESTSNVLSTHNVRSVDPKLDYLDADDAPLEVITRKISKERVENPKVEWGSKELAPRWDRVNDASGITAGETTLVVDNGSYFQIGSVVNVPRTGENFRVTAISTNSLTIARSVGDTAAAAINDDDDLVIIGNAQKEGADVGTESSVQEALAFNYTQIMREPFGQTRTQSKTATYFNETRASIRREHLTYHRIDIERQILFGQKALDATSTANPLRYMGGVLEYVTTNVVSSVGTWTEPEIEDWSQDLFAHTGGSGTRLLLVSPLVASALNQIAAGRLQVAPKESTYGVAIKQWLTAHGTLLIATHRLLENGAGGNGYGGYAIALDPQKLGWAYIDDTQLLMDRQGNGVDGWTDEWLTEGCLKLKSEKLHGVSKGITG